MGKKSEKLDRAKPGKAEAGDRWTVRGVPGRLQKAAAVCARADGVTVGIWLTKLVDRAVAGRLPPADAGGHEDWKRAVEARLERLERALAAPASPA